MNLRVILKLWLAETKTPAQELAHKTGLTKVDVSRFLSGRELSLKKMGKLLYWLLLA